MKTFASAFVRQLFVEWPKLRAQIGANKTTDWAEMDLAVRNNWTYEQAVRESVSCLPTCLLHMFMFANMENQVGIRAQANKASFEKAWEQFLEKTFDTMRSKAHSENLLKILGLKRDNKRSMSQWARELYDSCSSTYMFMLMNVLPGATSRARATCCLHGWLNHTGRLGTSSSTPMRTGLSSKQTSTTTRPSS